MTEQKGFTAKQGIKIGELLSSGMIKGIEEAKDDSIQKRIDAISKYIKTILESEDERKRHNDNKRSD